MWADGFWAPGFWADGFWEGDSAATTWSMPRAILAGNPPAWRQVLAEIVAAQASLAADLAMPQLVDAAQPAQTFAIEAELALPPGAIAATASPRPQRIGAVPPRRTTTIH